MDLIRLIMERLSPQLIGQIASALGLDRAATEKAISAAVPALLSALVGLVSKPDGATRLATTLQQQDPDQLERAASTVGSGDQQALIDQSTGSLASLFGNDALGSLTSALGRFAGTGEGQARSLLGLVAPLVLSVLGRQQKTSGLDATGLANLLTSQKDAIAGALPSGLANLLSGTGLLQGISDRLRDTGAAATRATEASAASLQNAARSVPSPAQRAPASGSSSMRWAWVAAVVVVVAALAYYYVGGKRSQEMAERATEPATQATQQATGAASKAAQQTTEAAKGATKQTTEAAKGATKQTTEAAKGATKQTTEAAKESTQQTTEAAKQATQQAAGAASQATGAASQATQQAPEAASQAATSVANLTVGDVNLSERITTFFDDAKKTLEGVTDAKSAEAARPKLQELAANLDQISGLAGQLPADGKQAFTGMIDKVVPTLRPLIDKVLAMPGVGEVLQATLEPMKAKLQAMATV
jgi:chemotaxis protein histidine kinase CheA